MTTKDTTANVGSPERRPAQLRAGSVVSVSVRSLFPPTGGGDVSMLETTAALRGAGLTVCAHSRNADPRAPFDRVIVVPDRFRAAGTWVKQFLNGPAWRRAIEAQFAAVRPACVLTQQEFLIPSVGAANSLGIPVAAFLTGTDYLEMRPQWDKRPWAVKVQTPAWREIRRRFIEALQVADVVVANSNFTRSEYRKVIGKRIYVSYPIIRRPNSALKGVRSGPVLMVTPHVHKGAEVMLGLATRFPERRFIVIGRGDARIVQALAALGNVRYMPWVDDIYSVLAGASVTVVPTKMPEAFGRIVAESEMANVPVLASRCGGLPEVTGEGGILVDSYQSIDAWESALRTVLRDEELYECLCRNCADVDDRMRKNSHDVADLFSMAANAQCGSGRR